jgi:hypothetical protein
MNLILFLITVVLINEVSTFTDFDFSRFPNCDIYDYGSPSPISSLSHPTVLSYRNKSSVLKDQKLRFAPKLRPKYCYVLLSSLLSIKHSVLRFFGYREDSAILLFALNQKNPQLIMLQTMNNFRRFNAHIYFIFPSSFEVYCILCPHFHLKSGPDLPCGNNLPLNNKAFFGGTYVEKGGRVEGSCRSTIRDYTCWPDERLIVTTSNSLNFTVVYSESRAEKMGKFFPTYLSQESYLISNRDIGTTFAPFIRDTEEYFPFYCEDELKFPQVSYSYWSEPFDLMTWAMLGSSLICAASISSVVITHQCTTTNPSTTTTTTTTTTVFSSILNYGVIPLRQCFRRRMLPLELLFCFCTFFLSMDYESFITSKITIPNPPILARDLRELVEDWGYKVFYPVDTIEQLQSGQDLHEFKYGFKRYGLSHVFYESIQPYEFVQGQRMSKEWTLSRRGAKVITDLGINDRAASMLEWKQYEIKLSRHCHTADKPFFRRYVAQLVNGRGFQRILRFYFLTLENGLMDFWKRSFLWFQDSKRTARALRHLSSISSLHPHRDQEQKQGFVAVKLNKKVVQIFQMWGVGGTLSILWLIMEIFLHCVSRRKNAVRVTS